MTYTIYFDTYVLIVFYVPHRNPLWRDIILFPSSINIVLSWSKAAGAWCWPPTPSSAEVKEREQLNLYSNSGPSWPVIGWTVLYWLLGVNLFIVPHFTVDKLWCGSDILQECRLARWQYCNTVLSVVCRLARWQYCNTVFSLVSVPHTLTHTHIHKYRFWVYRQTMNLPFPLVWRTVLSAHITHCIELIPSKR